MNNPIYTNNPREDVEHRIFVRYACVDDVNGTSFYEVARYQNHRGEVAFYGAPLFVDRVIQGKKITRFEGKIFDIFFNRDSCLNCHRIIDKSVRG